MRKTCSSEASKMRAQNTQLVGAKRLRMQMPSTKPEGAKQLNKQVNKQTNKQLNKQTNKQTNKQANKTTYVHCATRKSQQPQITNKQDTFFPKLK